ncbi:MAG: MBOAT family protein, partial [Clostridia bacterium]|nr:MBOAT family protein [Clostridia bacterium]
MSFNSLQFLIFLPVVLLLYWLLPHKVRWVLLLLASYYFYMSWNPQLIFLILGTTLVSYLGGLFLEKTTNPTARKAIMIVCVCICL